MSGHALVVISFRIRMPRDPTRSKCVKKETPLLLHWLALRPMLQLVDVDGLAPKSLFARPQVSCCLLLDDPLRAPRVCSSYSSHPSHTITTNDAHAPARTHSQGSSTSVASSVRGLGFRSFNQSTRYPPANKMRTLSFLALVATAHAFTLPSFLGTPAERYVSGGLYGGRGMGRVICIALWKKEGIRQWLVR